MDATTLYAGPAADDFVVCAGTVLTLPAGVGELDVVDDVVGGAAEYSSEQDSSKDNTSPA